MAWPSVLRIGLAAGKFFGKKAAKKKVKRPQGSGAAKDELSHLTDDQKTFIDRYKGKEGSRKKQGEGGDWQSKKSLDNQ